MTVYTSPIPVASTTGFPSSITIWLKSIYSKFVNFYKILNEAKILRFADNTVKKNILAAQYNFTNSLSTN